MLNLLPKMTIAAAFVGCFVSLFTAAQGQAKASGASDLSRIDIYGGYGLWDPINSDIYGKYYPKLYNPNATLSATYWFTQHLGATVEGEYFSRGRTLNTAGGCNAVPCSPAGQRVYTAEAGLEYRREYGRFVPYAQVLGGLARINGPYLNNLKNGWATKAGLGFDYVLPYLHGLFAVRPIEADFEYDHVDYGPLFLPAATNGGVGQMTIAKFSSGLVLRLGGGEIAKGHTELMLNCDATPGSVYAGEPVQISATPTNLKPKNRAIYMFSATGGKVTPGQMGASIATDGLAPGDYQVTGSVSDGSRASEQAKCSSSFTVKAFEPPTLSCSADPGTVQAGGVTTIMSVGSSAANRTLTYSFSTNSGTLSGTGNKVQLSTAGATSGTNSTVNVTCNVVDDLGKTASATAQVSVIATARPAPPPPLPEASTLCAVFFERDKRRPVRVDNEAKACLDDIALNLQRQPDAKLVVIGNFAPRELQSQGAQRSLNVKQYLTDEKGIDAARIESRVGDQTGRSVDDLLVPPGASFDRFKGKVFDPASVKRVGPAYGKAGGRVATGHRRGRRAVVRAHTRTTRRSRTRRAAGAEQFTQPGPMPPVR